MRKTVRADGGMRKRQSMTFRRTSVSREAAEKRLQEEALMDDERVIEIEVERLRTFEGHPYKVTDDHEMRQLMESIRQYGILNPLIVRPVPEGVYEIIAGHRRKHAAEELGYRKVPVIIRYMKDDEAVIAMVDSNLHR